MGLDMYAWAVPESAVAETNGAAVLPDNGPKPEELYYWRKFNHLHGWMERLYRAKGGTEVFNCVAVRLTEQDLDALEQASKSAISDLPATQGFFFGGPELYPEDVESIKDFIAKARAAIKQGKAVLYDSWW